MPLRLGRAASSQRRAADNIPVFGKMSADEQAVVRPGHIDHEKNLVSGAK